MNNADSNEQPDTDSKQDKPEVLRAKDIIPPLRTPTPAAPSTQQPVQKASPGPAVPGSGPEKRTIPTDSNLPQPRPKPATTTPLVQPAAEQTKSDIPRFDLAEKIMAEQRRITAVRRKGPGQQDEAQEQEREAESLNNTEEPVPQALSEEEQIIAEIVSRDIEVLCRGPISKASK